MLLISIGLEQEAICMRFFPVLLFSVLAACSSSVDNNSDPETRADGSYRLNIDLAGSLQNPAFSPDGTAIVFTRFRDGYNRGVADLFIYELESEKLHTLLSDHIGHINLPGSSWNEAKGTIVFASTLDPHDEIFSIPATGTTGDEVQITSRQDLQAFEPTFSPDGQWVVFESHPIDVETRGVITKYEIDGSSGYVELTQSGDDCRQPNWSPAGDRILYQKKENGTWSIWTIDADGGEARKITPQTHSATDAVFSHDGDWIIYSSENDDVDISSIYKVPSEGGSPVRLTSSDAYDGAPSISPDGDVLAFESTDKDPDGSTGTSIWLKELSD